MKDSQVKEALDRSSKEAEEMMKSGPATKGFLGQLEAQLGKYGRLKDAINDVKLMISLIKDFIDKKYTDVPYASIIAILGGLIYLANPMDIIPDVLPIVGQVDDVAVIGFCVLMCKSDLDNYKAWLAEQNESNTDQA